MSVSLRAKQLGLALLAGAGLFAVSANAGLTLRVAVDPDNLVDTENRTGASSGGDSVSTWTAVRRGDNAGIVTENSTSSITLSASGTNEEGNELAACQEQTTASDMQIEALIPATYGQYTENFTQFGVQFFENDNTSHLNGWPNIGTARFKFDAGGAGENEQSGAAGQFRPRYLAGRYDHSESELCAFESDDAATWSQIGTCQTVTFSFPVDYCVYGTSHDPLQTTEATLTNIAYSTTLDITDGGAPSPPTGSDTLIATGTSSFNGNSNGVEPGDTVTLDGTSRGDLTIDDLVGTAANPITIRNDTTETGPLVIAGTFECRNCQYVILNGLGKWSGAPAGSCGITVSGGQWEYGRTQCGIQVRPGSGSPTHLVRFSGNSTGYEMYGVEVDGSGLSNGIGVSANDQSETTLDFREDLKFSQNYVHDIPTEGFYLGQNWFRIEQGNPQLRNVEASYNLIERTGRQCINLKAAPTGTNVFHHNYCEDAANEKSTGMMDFNEAQATGYANRFFRNSSGGRDCIGAFVGDAPGTLSWNFYNNLCVGSSRRGIFISYSSNGSASADIDYNTIVDTSSGEECIRASSGVSGNARGNICANTDGLNTSMTESNNRVGSVSQQQFADTGNDDYALTASSPAVDSGTTAAPATDILGIARPQGSADDQGAFEYVP